MALPFETSSRVYDLLYKDKDYAAEAEFIHQCLCSGDGVPETLLELGSGTGVHAHLLAQKGHSMKGVDLSAGMISRANALREQQPPDIRQRMEFHEGNVRTFKLGSKVDAVVSLFHVVSYQTTNGQVLDMFRNARDHLEPGGLFLFDVWYGPAVLDEPPAVRVKRAEGGGLEVTRLCEPALDVNRCTVDVRYTYLVREVPGGAVTESEEVHHMRYYFQPELEHFLESAGFQLAESFEWLTGTPLGSDTFGACFIAKAT